MCGTRYSQLRNFINVADTGMRQPTMDTLIGEMSHAGTEEDGKDMQTG